jgi:hypothetical protein
MVRRLTLAASAAALALSLAVPVAFAGSGNPAGTGQPGAECGEEGAELMPNGFTTGGFANAEDHYANSDAQGGLSSGNSHVVSQYDVACVHYTQAHS